MRNLSALLLAALLWAAAGGIAVAAEDYPVRNGWFFAQAGGGGGNGFVISDDAGVAFWREFRRLGGVQTLGYPASRRFVGADGFIYQATQAALLQWRPELEQAVLSNIFDVMSDAGRDGFLRSARGIPRQVTDDGSAGDPTRSAAIRLSWLEDEGIRRYYFASPNPAELPEWPQQRAIELYGLPTSRPERIGPFVIQRFQRVALQRWVESVPGMPAGSVVRVLGGDLMKEAGLLPPVAMQSAAADSPVARFDPELRAHLELLREVDPGRPLAELAERSGISLVWAPLEPNVGGLFSARRRWIAINLRWRDADPRAIAALIAHEMSHVRDVTEERPVWTSAGCFATEQAAFRTQGAVWEAFYGPGGKRPARSDVERQQNFILSSLRSDPDAFAARIAQIYQHECGELRR